MTPTVGLATAQSAAMSPWARAPISSTSASVSLGALSRVSGTPASLLYEPGLACNANFGASAAAVRSLVPVLPAEPVMPTTIDVAERRACRAAEVGERAERVVDPHDRGAVGPRGGRGRR